LWAWVSEPHTFAPDKDADDTDDSGPDWDDNSVLGRLAKMIGLGNAGLNRPPQPVDRFSGAPPPLPAPSPAAPPSPQEFLSGLLNGYRLEELRAIAKRHNWKLSGTAKDGIVKQLDGYLKEWAAAGNVTADLLPDEAWLAGYIGTVLGPDAAPTREFMDAAWRKTGKRDPRQFETIITGLVTAGLMFPCSEDGQLHYHILPYLTETTVPVLALELESLDSRTVERLTIHARPPALGEFERLLQAIKAMRLSLAPAPSPHPQEAQFAWLRGWKYDADQLQALIKNNQAMYPRPDVGIPVRLPLNILNDESARLAQSWTGASAEKTAWLLDVGMIATLFTPPATRQTNDAFHVNEQEWLKWDALAGTPALQVKRLWHAWSKGGSDTFFELAWAARRHGNLAVMRAIAMGMKPFTTHDLMSELTTARLFLARVLAGAGGQWIAWNDLARLIFELKPNLLNNRFTRQSWWLAMTGGNHKRYDPRNRNDWDKSVRHVLLAMLEGPLHWLGVVELGYERNTLAALRVTPLGRWLLTGRGEPPAVVIAEQAAEPPAWLDTETWRIPPGTVSAELMATCRFLGEPTGQPFTYRLTALGIERALLSGRTPQSIATQFESAAIPIPAAALARIEQAATRIGRVRLYEGLALIECADDFALKELLVGAKLKAYIVCQLAPRLAVVRSENVDELVKELINKGYTPRVV
jgi:hypothetical protein